MEEIIEVSKIQLRVYNEIAQQPKTPRHYEALAELDGTLLNLTELFNKYAKKFKLYESQLAILHCAGNFPGVALEVWRSIIEQEGSNRTIIPLKNKLLSLGIDFYPSELVFPLRFLVNHLEKFSFENRKAEDHRVEWVVESMHQIGVPSPTLFEIYVSLFNDKESPWYHDLDARFYLLSPIYFLLLLWSPQLPSKFFSSPVKSFVAVAQEFLEKDPKAKELIARFQNLVQEP